MKGISRAVSKKSKGWLVRIYREGETYSKFFSDQKHQGKYKALKVARAYLRDLERRYPRPPRLPFRTQPLRQNSTGINGVSETFHRSRRNGEKIPCFSVNYRLEGVVYNKRFYIHHYDTRAAALKDAARFRREMEKLMLREWKRQQKQPRAASRAR